MSRQLLTKEGERMLLHTRDHCGQWMNIQPTTIDVTMTIREAKSMMTMQEQLEMAVVENGRFLGVIRIWRCLRSDDDQQTVENVIERPHAIVDEHCSLRECKESLLYVVHHESGILSGVIGMEERLAFTHYLEEQEEKQRQMNRWLMLSLDTAYEGVVIVDHKGIIQVFNETYSRFVGVTKEEAIGRPVEEVIENTRIPVVLKTGVPERSQAHRLQGQELVVHRLPMWQEGEIIGAVGMLVFEGKTELEETLQRLERIPQAVAIEESRWHKHTESNVSVRFEDIIGESPAIASAKKIGRKAAVTEVPVLLTGETGVGKEPFAHAIHHKSHHQKGPFVAVNCAAIPESLFESELFGYLKGAFTGTRAEGKVGKVELANGGTLFLDEIGDMPFESQAKILRVLETKQVERVGGSTPVHVDFRLVAATNQDLKAKMLKGTFREDLYYRLNVIHIEIPPLRERKQDIPSLIAHHLKLREQEGFQKKTLTKAVLERMFSYSWPGNVRELFHYLERMYVLSEGPIINEQDLPKELLQRTFIPASSMPPPTSDQELIYEALKEAKGNKSEAAKQLGISRATLYNKLAKYGLSV
ncbi:sigma 54-interacting transcriptional regulator [Geomicrobium sediminis]|uniref:Transcriptional regulator with PAS, ATPase and Fis domain n=1 Tax=Geomicrobium sediminis TaxID=1347788 RepID=A0ABS2PFW6_9BACL|nr:sigma 54-interacting transcriptional regulator [Geomicrobium sediminis]MBM7634313.1 transcriptional regulator with PAS, ATPase and Fis domain [Geomicrobium sediminis]